MPRTRAVTFIATAWHNDRNHGISLLLQNVIIANIAILSETRNNAYRSAKPITFLQKFT